MNLSSFQTYALQRLQKAGLEARQSGGWVVLADGTKVTTYSRVDGLVLDALISGRR